MPMHALSLRLPNLHPLGHNQIAARRLDTKTLCILVHAQLDVLDVGGDNAVWDAIGQGASALIACRVVEANGQRIVVAQWPVGEA